LVEKGAGLGAGLSDAEYAAAGAEITAEARQVFARSDLIVKVKEPLSAERKQLRSGQALFTYLHLAPDPEQTRDLISSGVTAIAYETVTDANGKLPLLAPMSRVAGRMAPQVGAHYLERPHGGRGVLLGGVPGVEPANVLVIGAGVVGRNATLIAAGMQADVTVTARSAESLKAVAHLGGRVRTAASTNEAIEALCRKADLVIATALIPGAMAPKLISAATVKSMKPGSVIVDVSIDQGGNAETSRPTTSGKRFRPMGSRSGRHIRPRLDVASRALMRPSARPHHIVISGSKARSFWGSGISVMVASVNRRTLATDTAFSSATRTTLVGSMMPASTRSTYSLRPASKP
jgi:alanine dehydrogenase